MHIRVLTPEDLAAHCKVSSMAYHWSCKLEEQVFPEQGTLLGCFDDTGTLIAELNYNIRQAVWGNTTLPLACIGGVASLPHYRRAGAVRRLFDELETLAQRESWVFGALYPFADGYYRQFGYERGSRQLQLEVPLQEIHALSQSLSKNALGKIELIEGEGLPSELLDVYNTYAANVPLMLRRTQEHTRWFTTKPLEKCRYCFLWRNTEGKAEGYLQFYLNLETRTLEVGEVAYLSPAALKGLLCFLWGYASKAEKVRFRALPWGSPIPLLLNEHSQNQAHYATGAAIRIYDAQQALSKFRYLGFGEFRFTLENDSITRNNGTYRVAYQNGICQVERLTQTARVSLSREALVLLLSGQIKNTMALQCCPGVKTESEAEAQLLLQAFQTTALPMMWDGF